MRRAAAALCLVGHGARIVAPGRISRSSCIASHSSLSETNYEVLDELLRTADAESDAAESHGALTGLACTGGITGPEPWLAQAIGDLDPADPSVERCRIALLGVYRSCCGELGSDQMTFSPLLPDDEEGISVRAAALGRWCQGFLFGLSLGGIPDLEQLPANVAEIIRDLAEITRAGVDEASDQEQSENAYTQIVEFIRVSVQLLHEELNPPVEPQDQAPTLH